MWAWHRVHIRQWDWLCVGGSYTNRKKAVMWMYSGVKEVLAFTAAVIPLLASRGSKWVKLVKLQKSPLKLGYFFSFYFKSTQSINVSKERTPALFDLCAVHYTLCWFGWNFQFSTSGIQSAGWWFNPVIPRLRLGSKPRSLFPAKLFCYCAQILLVKMFPLDNSERAHRLRLCCYPQAHVQHACFFLLSFRIRKLSSVITTKKP